MINRFEIKAVYAGWMDGVIRDENTEHIFSYSYMRDFPSDIMMALLYLNDDWEEDRSCFAGEWEPAVDIWTLSRRGDVLMIDIRNYSDESRAELERKITLKYDYREFLGDFIRAMSGMIQKHGLFGYRNEWEFEFPIGLYLKLADVYEKSNIVTLTDLKPEENLGNEARISSLRNEMDIFIRTAGRA